MSKQSMWLKRLLVTINFMVLLSSCLFWQPEQTYETQISTTEGIYSFNVDTIMGLLKKGDFDVFEPLRVTPEPKFSLNDKTIPWRQAEYLLLTKVFHEFVWKTPIDDWKLHQMVFRVACEDIDHGFLFGDFTYFKIVNVNQKEIRVVHNIHIKPVSSTIEWWDQEYYPIKQNWEWIDLTQLLVSVDDALIIAEKNGGLNVRSAISNKCTIYLTLAPDGLYDGWQIVYSGRASKHLFNIDIDPTTGKFTVVDP